MPTLAKPKPKKQAALQATLDQLVSQYKTPAYIESDPIQIPYRYLNDPKACEMSAFITALFSYGRRDLIIATMGQLFKIMGPDPVGFLESFNPKQDARLFQHFVYRFNKGPDVVFLLSRLQQVYQHFDSLEAFFMHAALSGNGTLKNSVARFTDDFLGTEVPDRYGIKFLFAHPDRGGACKRFNMFLRWMVRIDADPKSRVDFGLWQQALQPSQLLVPLDTHILKMNQKLGLSSRKDSSWQTAEEITEVFRRFCPEDPIQYDYALFGFSLAGRSIQEFHRQ